MLKDKLTALTTNQWNVSRIAEFLSAAPENGQFLKEVVRSGLEAVGLLHLPLLKELSGSLLTDTQLSRRAIDLSAKGIPLDWFRDALRQDPKRNPDILREILRKPVFEFHDFYDMLSYIDTEKFAKYFPHDPDLKQKLPNSSNLRDSTETTKIFADFMDGDLTTRPVFVKHLLSMNVEPGELSPEKLAGLQSLSEAGFLPARCVQADYELAAQQCIRVKSLHRCSSGSQRFSSSSC